MGLFGVHVHQHPVSGGSLAAVTDDRIAVVEMRMLADMELHLPPGVQPDLKVPFRVDLFNGSALAVGNVFVPVGRGELHAVTG